MEIDKNERNDRTVWRKYLRYEEGEGFMPETKSASVFCIREVSGYAVWYCRNLNNEAAGDVPDGSYLLRFFAPEARHPAIEFAVLAAKPGLSMVDAIAALDAEAKVTMSMIAPEEIKPVFEQVR
jgi:hypothetical protein